jgi:hypothetical protein
MVPDKPGQPPSQPASGKLVGKLLNPKDFGRSSVVVARNHPGSHTQRAPGASRTGDMPPAGVTIVV